MLEELNSIKKINTALTTKKISCKELLDIYYNNIEKYDKQINSFICLTKEIAYKQAAIIDDKISKKENISLLTGIPIGIKDNICVKDATATCGSKILQSFRAPYNATVIEKIIDADMLILGKLNMDEFAMGSSNETSAFGIVRNPWNTECIPGGSSGGSAAAVAARFVNLALGSDTGGSIRQPAALCGVSGLKPTYGRVSRFGLIAFASSLDQIGPFANNIEDMAELLKIIASYDSKDSTSVNLPQCDYSNNLSDNIKGMRIGIPKEYFSNGLADDMRQIVEKAINQFVTDLGCNIVEISLPHTEYAVPVYYIIATAEASSNLARYDGVKYGYRAEEYSNLIDMYERTRSEGFGDEVKRRIMLGTYTLSAGYYDAYYKKAQKVRTLIKSDFDKAFENCDFIITPTSPTTAFKIGEKISNPLEMYLSDIYTISINLAGLPAISTPCGFINNLPAAIQIIGNVFDEQTILNAAFAFEKINNYNKKLPPLIR